VTKASESRRTPLGAWLAGELEERKLSYRDFWKASNISVTSLSRWMKFYELKERPELPSRKMVRRIADALGYKSGAVQLLVDQSWAEYNGVVVSPDMPKLSPQARLFAERFDKLPKIVRDALWRAAFGEEGLGGGEEK
jgi:transcriptional regulator with XRE-family HTH domain